MYVYTADSYVHYIIYTLQKILSMPGTHKTVPCYTKTVHFGMTEYVFCVQSTLYLSVYRAKVETVYYSVYA